MAIAILALASACGDEPQQRPSGGWGGAAKVVTERIELRPLVDRQQFAGLESVPDAVEYLLAGQNLGKVVVDLRDRGDLAIAG